MEASLSGMSDTELIHTLLDTERTLIATRMRHSMNQLENTAYLKQAAANAMKYGWAKEKQSAGVRKFMK